MNFLCLEFTNSSWYITHHLFTDPLRDNIWLMKLAGNWDIKPLSNPTEAEVQSLLMLRDRLSLMIRRLVEGQKLTSSDIELLNGYMRNQSFYRQLKAEQEAYRLKDMPINKDWDWFMAEVAASFAKLCTAGAVENLKACQNPECGWFFIDESKSGSRKWCDDNCATLMKVRRFREKQKNAGK